MNTKRLLRAIAIAFVSFVFSACSKDIVKDDSDAFVGTYSVSLTQHVIWGGDSGTLSDSGTLHITKVSNSRVKTSGYFSTYGEVVDSFIYFEPLRATDGSGYFTTTFNQGILVGNVLTFSANRSGQLAYNGVLYPFRSSDSFTAIKQQ